MMSKAAQYAIRAVLYLVQHSSVATKLSALSIAKELKVPQPFLAKLLRQLASNELVSSTKGPQGGFFLTDKEKENHLWDVVVCIDGGDKFEQCFLGLPQCSGMNPCPVHHIVAPFRSTLLNTFREKTIAQIVEDMEVNHTLISFKGLGHV